MREFEFGLAKTALNHARVGERSVTGRSVVPGSFAADGSNPFDIGQQYNLWQRTVAVGGAIAIGLGVLGSADRVNITDTNPTAPQDFPTSIPAGDAGFWVHCQDPGLPKEFQPELKPNLSITLQFEEDANDGLISLIVNNQAIASKGPGIGPNRIDPANGLPYQANIIDGSGRTTSIQFLIPDHEQVEGVGEVLVKKGSFTLRVPWSDMSNESGSNVLVEVFDLRDMKNPKFRQLVLATYKTPGPCDYRTLVGSDLYQPK